MDNTPAPLRILIVDDSAVYRSVLRKVFSAMPDVEVVGTAADGCLALQQIERLGPDLVSLDIEMPKLDGLQVLQRLREQQSSLSAIVLSALTSRGAEATTRALQLGAFDFVLKPQGHDLRTNLDQLYQCLAPKVEAFRKTRATGPGTGLRTDGNTPGAEKAAEPLPTRAPAASSISQPIRLVAIGVSTGGPAALSGLLPRLPASFSAPILIVQHMPRMFTQSLAEELNRHCRLAVCEASDGQRPEPGQVLIAPGGYQMGLVQEGPHSVVRITDDPPEHSCRPSVDYLFRSVASTYRRAALGLLMTGMGEDGTQGSRLIKQQGGTIVAQDRASCVVFGMPRKVIEEGIADAVAPLDRLPEVLLDYVPLGVPQ